MEENQHEDDRPEEQDASESPAQEGQEATREDGLEADGLPDWVADGNAADIGYISTMMMKVQEEASKVLIGQGDLVQKLLVALITGGNVLVEGVPGIAKTMTARTLARCINAEFSRIQFTPDLMPADILGTTVFNVKESEFEFRKGPIFSNLILIDEVNRAPAKTQAALIEVMEERQVTIEGHSYSMEEPFFIMATQNPVEQEGTYKLPEAQMDRFLFRLKLHYPDLESEKAILERFQSDFQQRKEEEVQAVLTKEDLKKAQQIVESVHIKDELIDYLARIVIATRNNGDLYLGASPRASLGILRSAKAMALIKGRGFVTPDDIKEVVYPVLNHRIILSHEREMEGMDTEELIKGLIDDIEVPR
ncbi:MAG: MoxR family ATPase [Flavobacteriales bacterium]|nr:MoxR family ATPase [Flavobacteriales bacterium]